MRRGQRRGPLGHPFPRRAQGGCRAGRPGGHTWATCLAAELPGCADRRPGEHRTSLLRLPRSPFSLLSFWSSFPLPPSLFSRLSLPFFTLFCLSLFSISLPFILKTTSFLCSLAFFLGGPSWLSSFRVITADEPARASPQSPGAHTFLRTWVLGAPPLSLGSLPGQLWASDLSREGRGQVRNQVWETSLWESLGYRC